MGLFDTIIFNKSVIQGTDPKVDKYLTLLGENELGWQTKDFDCLLSNFFIEEGKLFEEKVEKRWVEENGPFGGFLEPISKEKIPYNKTCTINAYDFLQSETVDIWIEMDFVFIDGVLQKTSLVKYEETNSAERLERLAKFQKELSESIKFGKTFRGKMQRAFGNFLGLVSRKIINLGNYIQRISFKF
jgi:hypothetical protein